MQYWGAVGASDKKLTCNDYDLQTGAITLAAHRAENAAPFDLIMVRGVGVVGLGSWGCSRQGVPRSEQAPPRCVGGLGENQII